jgi:quinol monooxygenase YgiN
MKIRFLISTACLIALAAIGCASSETGSEETTPAAQEGAPSTVEPTTGAETTATQPAPATTPAPVSPEPTTATPAASPTQPQMAQPTVGAVVTHKVKDFDAWKTAFDAHEGARKAAGIVAHSVMRDATNDKLVSVWVGGTDQAKLQAFFADKATKDVMKEAGVVGAPKILVMTPVSMKEDMSHTAKASAMIETSVKDLAAFKTAFEQDETARQTAGILGYGVAQDVTKPNSVCIYLQSDDVAKIKTYVEAKETKATWKTAGVKGAAKTSYQNEVDMKMYAQ